MTFAILAALSALLWFPSRYYLPETKIEVNSRALQPARLWRNYKRPLAAPDFLLCTTLSGCSIGVVYTALIGAPNLVLNVLGMGTLAIVIVAIAALIGFAVGAVPSTLLNKRVRDIYRVIADLCVLLTGSFTLLSVAVFIGKQGALATYLIPMAFCFTSVGLVVPVSTARAMTPFDHIAGTASSVLGFTRMALLQPKSESTSHRASRFALPASYKDSARPSLPHSVVSRRRRFQALKPDGSIWVPNKPKCSQQCCSAIRPCSCFGAGNWILLPDHRSSTCWAEAARHADAWINAEPGSVGLRSSAGNYSCRRGTRGMSVCSRRCSTIKFALSAPRK